MLELSLPFPLRVTRVAVGKRHITCVHGHWWVSPRLIDKGVVRL